MGGFFNPEKGIWAFLSWMVDIFGLSLLWAALCMPVVTIGPATAALYYTVVKCVRKQENGAFGVYLRSFRSNLKTGLKATLIALPPAVILVVVHLVSRWYGIRAGGLLYVMYVAQYFVLFIPAGVLCWLFPLLGRFEYRVRDLFRTAFQLTLAHLPSTVAVVVLTAQVAAFCAAFWWPVLFMPAVVTLLDSLFTERVFREYAPELEGKGPEDAVE